jgi:hypothetical protein
MTASPTSRLTQHCFEDVSGHSPILCDPVLIMDDYETDRIASDNPALTAPAAQRAPINRNKSRNSKQAYTNGSKSSGDSATIAELTKYDVSAPVTIY